MILFHAILLVTLICGFQAESGNVSESFIGHGLVPDVLSLPPASAISVEYESGAIVSEGNVLSVPQILTAPSVSWDAQDGVNYTVLMIDPDAPSRSFPLLRSFLHWLVINARNDDVTTGDTIADYITPSPPPGSGLHRYAFLVYRQPSEFAVEDFETYRTVGRMCFSPNEFAAQKNLGDPIGGNFYQAEISNATLI